MPSFSFPATGSFFGHPAQTYSVLFGPDGQPHYIPNPMPQAIQDINGNLTYAYPPQAFQPAQAMSHHAWAHQQNAFAYHHGDDVEMEAATPEHRHSVASRNVSRSPAGRHRARTEDAEGESDDEYDEEVYLPPVSMKRSRSSSVTSESEESQECDDDWQPTRKSVKISSHQRKAVDTKRQDGRKALMQIEAEAKNMGRIRYTSNAEDKQTDRVSGFLLRNGRY